MAYRIATGCQGGFAIIVVPRSSLQLDQRKDDDDVVIPG